MKSRLLIAGLVFGVGSIVTLACSSSSTNDTPVTGCPSGSSGSGQTPQGTCSKCESAMCSAQTSAVDSACGPCLSACACNDIACYSACATEAGCKSAVSNLQTTCDQGVCATACEGTSSASTTSASSGQGSTVASTSSGAGGSGAGASTGTTAGVGGSSATTGSGAGGSTGSVGPGSISCNLASQSTCIVFPASVGTACATEGGTVVASCSTTDLLGCCAIGGAEEICYYTGAGTTADVLQQACTAAMGTWSTTP